MDNHLISKYVSPRLMLVRSSFCVCGPCVATARFGSYTVSRQELTTRATIRLGQSPNMQVRQPQADVGAQLRLRVRALCQGHIASGDSGEDERKNGRAVGWNAVRLALPPCTVVRRRMRGCRTKVGVSMAGMDPRHQQLTTCRPHACTIRQPSTCEHFRVPGGLLVMKCAPGAPPAAPPGRPPHPPAACPAGWTPACAH